MVATRAFPGWGEVSAARSPGKKSCRIKELSAGPNGQWRGFNRVFCYLRHDRRCRTLCQRPVRAGGRSQVARSSCTGSDHIPHDGRFEPRACPPARQPRDRPRAAGQGAAGRARRRRHQGPDPQFHRRGGGQRPRPRAGRHGDGLPGRAGEPSRRDHGLRHVGRAALARPAPATRTTRCAACSAATRFPSTRASSPRSWAAWSSRSARACSIRPSAASCSVCSLP